MTAISLEPLFADRGASFCTHRLIQNGSQYSFKPTVGCYLFFGIFLLISVGLIVGSLYYIMILNEQRAFLPLIIGGIFLCVSKMLYADIPVNKTIDTAHMQISLPESSFKDTFATRILSFADVQCLQIVRKTVETSDSNFDSYELNLVLSSSERVNLIDHGGLTQIKEDAEKMSRLLGVTITSNMN